MELKIAVASTDGKFINQHFGRAKEFLIFTLNSEEKTYEFVELRTNAPPCGGQEHDDNLLEQSVNLLSDCKVVLVSQIGPGAARALDIRGIKSFAVRDFIDDTLSKLLQSKISLA